MTVKNEPIKPNGIFLHNLVIYFSIYKCSDWGIAGDSSVFEKVYCSTKKNSKQLTGR